MILKIFAVFDSKAGVFGTPVFMGSVGLAVRAFTDLVNDGKSSMWKYPEDFSLHEIGEFDDNKGVLIPLKASINLGLASGFKNVSVPRPSTPITPSISGDVKDDRFNYVPGQGR